MIPIALAILVYGMISAVLGTLLPDLSSRLAFTDAQNGTIAFVQSTGLIVASLFTGPLIGRRGTKTALVSGLALVTVSLFGLARATGFATVAWSLSCLGFASGMVATATNTAASELNPAHRAATLNLLNLFFGLGGFLTPLIGALWFAGNTLALCYLLSLFAAGVLLMHFLLPPSNAPSAAAYRLSEAAELLGNRSLLLICLFLFLYVACEVGVWNWFAKHLVTQGVPESAALRTISFGFASGIILGRFAVSRVRIPVLRLTLGCSVLMAATTWAMLHTANVLIAGALVFCAGLVMAPVFPSMVAFIADRFPVMTSTAIGIAVTSGWVGLAISSKLIAIAGLLVLPVFAVLMIGVNLALRVSLRARACPPAPIPA